MFPDEASATAWFERCHCPHCGNTAPKRRHPRSSPTGARGKGFSVRIGTALERSKVTLRKWAIAIYLEMTNLKGVSSMKLHRDLKVTQKTAWFMQQRIREAAARPQDHGRPGGGRNPLWRSAKEHVQEQAPDPQGAR